MKIFIKRYYIKILLIFLILFTTPIYPYEKFVDFGLLKKAGAPRIVENCILFTLETKENSIAYLRTNLDNWQKDHYFKLSLYNIYYAAVPYTFNIKAVKYKININGYWIQDPSNPEFTLDDYGSDLSTTMISDENKKEYFENTPIIEKTKDHVKTVTFKYYNPNAKEVNFVCSIDNWSHYTHPMKYYDNGLWITTKYFTQGTYQYYFLVDGKKVVDIENPNKLLDDKKGQVSFFIIE